MLISFIDISRNIVYGPPHPSPEGVKLMTMISMEQEAVPAALPTTYREVLGATRYRRAGTMTGWLNRKHRLFGRHFGSTGTGVVAATAWEAHVLAPSPIARSAHLREAAPPASLPFERKEICVFQRITALHRCS